MTTMMAVMMMMMWCAVNVSHVVWLLHHMIDVVVTDPWWQRWWRWWWWCAVNVSHVVWLLHHMIDVVVTDPWWQRWWRWWCDVLWMWVTWCDCYITWLMWLSQIRDDVEQLRAKRLPLLSALTQNDALIESELPVELARHCGANEQQITYFDEKEQVVCGPSGGQCVSIWRSMFELYIINSIFTQLSSTHYQLLTLTFSAVISCLYIIPVIAGWMLFMLTCVCLFVCNQHYGKRLLLSS